MKPRTLPWLALGLVVWAALPFVVPRYMADLLVFTGIYTVAGLGIGLLLGHCGIVNLAQATFYGLGAYASAYCTVMMGLPSIVGFLLGAVVSMALAYVIGRPILRLTGYFLALGTLALSAIASALFFEWDWLTGGTLGIGGIPKLDLFGFLLDRPSRYYFFVWIVAFACMAVAHNLVGSRTGLMLRAMRDSSTAAAALSIDLQSLRTRVFVVCALFGSLAGSLFAHHASFVSTQSFTVDRSISFLLIPVIGGATSIPGIVVGALFVTFLPELLSKLGDIHQILFGLALVAVVVLMPEGLVGAFGKLRTRLAKREGADMAEPLLALREVGHSFGGLSVLRSVTFDVPEGGIIGLIGPNGSGKTTLFNIVTGYIRPLAGTVTYRGAVLGRDTIQQRGLNGLVRTFQTPQVFEQMTVLENVMVGCTKLTRTTMLQDLLRTPASRGQMREIRERAEAGCERFGLTALRDLPAASLTAGQRRILEIARAVVGEPRLLLLDEPSSGLNVQEIDDLRDWIVRLNEEGITVLLVSHDMGLMTVARTVHTLYFGEIIASGDMAAIQRDPRVREVYLGV